MSHMKRLQDEFRTQLNEACKRDPKFGEMSSSEHDKMRTVWFAGAAGALNALMSSDPNQTTSEFCFRSDVLLDMRTECRDAAEYQKAMAEVERINPSTSPFKPEPVTERGLDCQKDLAKRFQEEKMAERFMCPIGPECPVCNLCTAVHTSKGKPKPEEPGDLVQFGDSTYRKDSLSMENPAIKQCLRSASRSLDIGGSMVFSTWGPIQDPVKVTRTGRTEFKIEPYEYDDDTDDDDSDWDDEPEFSTPGDQEAISRAINSILDSFRENGFSAFRIK